MRAAILITTLIFASSFASAVETAPDWRLASADGGSVRLSQAVKEKPVIVFFWASWCPYCKALMPHLQSIRLEYGDRVEILAIQIKDKADAAAFVSEAGYDFTVLPHGDDVADLYEIHSTPGVILVDQAQLVQFDLRSVPRYPLPKTDEKLSHGRKAGHLAPYWAAALRQSIDRVLQTAE